MANLFINAVDVTPSTTGVWVDIDVSADCPVGTTGVIIQVVNTASATRTWGLRKSGSTDDRKVPTYQLYQTWGYIGVNSSRVFQGYVSGTGLQFKLLGYFTSEGVFFTNAYTKTPGTLDSWTSVNCASEIPAGAKFAILEITYGVPIGLRPTGSTDNRLADNKYHSFALVKLDTNRTFDIYYGSGGGGIVSLVGYLTTGTGKANGVNVSLTSTGAYVNIDRSGDADATGAEAVLVEVYSPGLAYNYALRENGGTDDFYAKEYHAWGIVGLDANKILQGKIANANADFYIMGYLAAEPPPTYEYVGNGQIIISSQSLYHKEPREYTGNGQILVTSQSLYYAERSYASSGQIVIVSQSLYHTERIYIGNGQITIVSQSSYSQGREYVGSGQIVIVPQSDYFAVLGRQAIPVPYLLRYPSPRNGQTNVPVGNPIKFIIKSDMLGINIDTVKVKVTDSWGINIYDKTSPYFKYSGKKSGYEVEVRPPQPWAYEENVQAEIDAMDLAGVHGVVYEYVP